MKLIWKILLCCTLFLSTSTFAQTKGKPSIDNINSFDFSSTTLKSDVESARVIGLGESSHWMGETYKAKVSAFKYLHEECGVNVLALESGFYDIHKVNQQLELGIANKDSILKSLFGTWHTEEVIPLLDYIVESQNTNNPIKLMGIDCQSLRVSDSYLLNDLNLLCESLSSLTGEQISLDSSFEESFRNQLRLSTYFKPVPVKNTTVIHQYTSLIQSLISRLDSKDKYFRFWRQMIENIQVDYRKRYQPDKYLRDLQMAKNIYYYQEENRNDKIAIWAATPHLVYGTEHIEVKNKDNLRRRMGSRLKEDLNQQYYLIAFTAYQGKIGFKGYLGLMKRRIKSKKTNIETVISTESNASYLYINSAELKEHYNYSLTNILWAKPVEMDVHNVCDALFYVRKESIVKLIDKKGS